MSARVRKCVSARVLKSLKALWAVCGVREFWLRASSRSPSMNETGARIIVGGASARSPWLVEGEA